MSELTVPDDFVVVKFGSPSVTNAEGMAREKLDVYGGQVVDLSERFRVIVTTSGAIVTGRASWGGKPLPDQDYAAMGSGRTYMAWEETLLSHGMDAAQVMVTNHEIGSPEGKVLKGRLVSLTGNGIVPVANGNDVLSDEGAQELSIDTDNDRLAGHIASLVSAKHLILLTNKDGLIDRRGSVVRNVYPEIASTMFGLVDQKTSGERGGMYSKVRVAIDAMRNGITSHIARAGVDLQAVVDGEIGTHFVPLR